MGPAGRLPERVGDQPGKRHDPTCGPGQQAHPCVERGRAHGEVSGETALLGQPGKELVRRQVPGC